MDAINMNKNYAEICRLWMEQGMAKPGKVQRELARILGSAPSLPGKLMDGTQPIKLDELPIIAAYIGEPIPPPPGVDIARTEHAPENMRLEIEREIGIDTWRSSETLRNNPNIETISLTDDGKFQRSQLHAYRFEGDSMDDIKIADGDIILAVAYEATSETPLDGKCVVLERTIQSSTGPLTEVSLRIAKVSPDDSVEFITASKSGSYSPIIVDKKNRVKNGPNEKVRVVGVYIGLRRG